MDIASQYGSGVFMAILAEFDDAHADRLFEYVRAPTNQAALMEGVFIGGIDYNEFASSKGSKPPMRWKECF
jgi:hypothetical protein